MLDTGWQTNGTNSSTTVRTKYFYGTYRVPPWIPLRITLIPPATAGLAEKVSKGFVAFFEKVEFLKRKIFAFVIFLAGLVALYTCNLHFGKKLGVL